MTAWEKTLYRVSYNGKEAVVNVRAEIKHPAWSFEDQLVQKGLINDKGIIF